jgi:cyclopropane-fatty-acyl-phospholipid synthase
VNAIAAMTNAVERLPVPDGLLRAGIAFLVNRTGKRLGQGDAAAERDFAAEMAKHPIAIHTDAANAQHYEVPPEFFAPILGPRRKYSCCLYDGVTSLKDAEERALSETASHAALADGQRVLELGCGWGSLTLWMAEHYPRSQITAVSNSASQGAYIRAEAARRGLDNVTVRTADMNEFEPEATFDRVVSVEMFEHLSNWIEFLGRVRRWLEPDGRVFIHVFSHRAMPYRFDHGEKADWIAQHFFTGGIMPSHGLIRQLPIPFAVEGEWRWSGSHYRRTADDWLANYDASQEVIEPILRKVYGAEAGLWRRRWRLFFLATSGLFGAASGQEWGISHYCLRPS